MQLSKSYLYPFPLFSFPEVYLTENMFFLHDEAFTYYCHVIATTIPTTCSITKKNIRFDFADELKIGYVRYKH